MNLVGIVKICMIHVFMYYTIKTTNEKDKPAKITTIPKLSRKKKRIQKLLARDTKCKVVANRSMTKNAFFNDIINLITNSDDDTRKSAEDIELADHIRVAVNDLIDSNDTK